MLWNIILDTNCLLIFVTYSIEQFWKLWCIILGINCLLICHISYWVVFKTQHKLELKIMANMCYQQEYLFQLLNNNTKLGNCITHTPLNFILHTTYHTYFYELLHNLDNFQRKLSHDNLFNYFIILLNCFIILLFMQRFFNFWSVEKWKINYYWQTAIIDTTQ